MTSLSSNVANWRDSSFYQYGDTVFWEGQVYILNSTPGNVVNPYIPGVPPYPGDNVWFNPAGTVVPPPIPPNPFTTFQQTGANFDAEKGYGEISVSWTGGIPNKGITFLLNGSLITSPAGFYVDEGSSSATLYGLGTTPGATFSVQIKAIAISGSDTTSSAVEMSTLGPPPAATIALQTFSINPITGKGEVAITLNTNSNLANRPTEFKGYAIGSTGTDGQPNYEFSYDIGAGTAVFSGITNINGIAPPLSFKVFIQGSNSVGEGPISNILEENFNPNPPLPDNLDNLAIVTFLLGGADYTTGWSINTSGNPRIASYDCHTGAFTNSSNITIQYLQARQRSGVKVLLSLGGATWNVASGLSNGTVLAQNIAYAFFGVGTSPSGWVRYASNYGETGVFTFDGLDLDWEGEGTLTGTQELNFLTQFRALCPGVILSAAPQPPYNANTSPGTAFTRSAFTAHGAYQAFPTSISPVSAFNPENPAVPALFDINHLGFFDYIFVQYYNNPDWAPGAPSFGPNVAQWARMVQAAIPHRDIPGPGQLGTRFVLGLACADSVTPVYNGENDNGFIQQALQVARLDINAPTVENFCAGSGFWNSPTANFPDATNVSNPFFQLYNSDTGVPALATTQIIMMYCNASGIDPQWTNLPLLDFEEPPPLPPIPFVITNSIPPVPNNTAVLDIHLSGSIVGLIAIQAQIALVGTAGSTATELLRPVTFLTNPTIRDYTIAYGLQNGWFYDLSIKGLYATGTSEDSRITVQFSNANPGPFFNLNFLNGVPPNLPAVAGRVRITITAALQSAGGNVPSNTIDLSCWLATSTPQYTGGIFTNAVLLPPGSVIPITDWRTVDSLNRARDVYIVTGLPDTSTCWISVGLAQPGLRPTVMAQMAQCTVGL